MICSGLLQQPVLMSCCGQHFCESCLKKWYAEQGNKCPHCRNTGVTYLLNKERVRDINELRVYCSNKSKGCTWEGELGSLDGHVESNCGFTEIDCPKRCKMKLLRDKMSDHIRDSCLCRDYSCEHCRVRGTYHTITGECGDFGRCMVEATTAGVGNIQCSALTSAPKLSREKKLPSIERVVPLSPSNVRSQRLGARSSWWGGTLTTTWQPVTINTCYSWWRLSTNWNKRLKKKLNN